MGFLKKLFFGSSEYNLEEDPTPQQQQAIDERVAKYPGGAYVMTEEGMVAVNEDGKAAFYSRRKNAQPSPTVGKVRRK